MSTKPMNLLFILSDEHNKEMMGCSGHPVVKTPHLDRLAAKGVRFNSAYCNNPICVPSRASLATGRYVHQIGNWDNSTPYIGEQPSWGHRVTEQGHKVTTIGKLHYRNDSDDTGFPDKRISLNVVDGIGDIFSLVRDHDEPRTSSRDKIIEAGPGDSSYCRYDRGIAEEAIQFLQNEAHQEEKPWVLFVSFVTPHFPLIAPQEFFDLYPLESIILPKQYSLEERPMHPVIEAYRRCQAVQDEFDEFTIRKAIAAYYGMCSFLDHQIGRVVQTLEQEGLADNTRIIYTSDHGDTMGDHGVWFKSTMYEGSVAVPMIVAGPDLPKGKVVDTPVSLVDCFPTIVDCVGAKLNETDTDLPGTSLLSIAKEESDLARIVFSEYHAANSITGMFMIRTGPYKYVYYVDYAPQLFNLVEDPYELHDLAGNAAYADILKACEGELRQIVDPEEVDRRAKKTQGEKIAQYGGREAVLKGGNTIPYSPVPKQFR